MVSFQAVSQLLSESQRCGSHDGSSDSTKALVKDDQVFNERAQNGWLSHSFPLSFFKGSLPILKQHHISESLQTGEIPTCLSRKSQSLHNFLIEPGSLPSSPMRRRTSEAKGIGIVVAPHDITYHPVGALSFCWVRNTFMMT